MYRCFGVSEYNNCISTLTLSFTIVSRLLVGHSHFDVDQRHSVSSRHILGRRGAGDRGRRDLHSLSAFKECIKEAHSDLIFFSECTGNYNFDEWLSGMETKLEPGLTKHFQYQLRRGGEGVILTRSKPRMSSHVPYSQWHQIWPVERAYWPTTGARKGIQPSVPAFDSVPNAAAPQLWKSYNKVAQLSHTHT